MDIILNLMLIYFTVGTLVLISLLWSAFRDGHGVLTQLFKRAPVSAIIGILLTLCTWPIIFKSDHRK